MRAGDVVWYVDGHPAEAKVLAVVGSGPSGYKQVDLVTAVGQEHRAVPHVRDRNGMGYWCQGLTEVVSRRRKAPIHIEGE
jgi:hypothetical protein